MSESLFRRVYRRMTALPLPEQDDIHAYGSRGEEAVYRLLRENFDCVIRNIVIPWGEGYLEKDFLVVHKGVPVVLEVKTWKGRISATESYFCQDKPDGTHKDLKNPVVNMKHFLASMKDFYELDREALGIVVFSEPDCVLDLLNTMDGIGLVPASKLITSIRAAVKNADWDAKEFDPACVLHCARLYSNGREFCGGVIVDKEIPCYTENGLEATLNPLYVKYITLDHQRGRLRDKMTVTFTNGSSCMFYNHCASLTLHCLDGDIRRIALSKLKTVVF